MRMYNVHVYIRMYMYMYLMDQVPPGLGIILAIYELDGINLNLAIERNS